MIHKCANTLVHAKSQQGYLNTNEQKHKTHHINDLKLLALALQLFIHVLEHLLEPSALPVPGGGEQHADVLAIELTNRNLSAVTLEEGLAKHLLDVSMAFLGPGELAGEGVAVRVLDDVCHSRSDIAVDGLAVGIEKHKHRNLSNLETAGQLLVSSLAVERDSEPGHGREELFEGGFVLGRATRHGGRHVHDLKGFALFFH